MTVFLMFVVGMAIAAGATWVMVRMQRSHRELIESRREAWRAGGCIGREPGRGCSGGGDVGNYGGGGY